MLVVITAVILILVLSGDILNLLKKWLSIQGNYICSFAKFG